MDEEILKLREGHAEYSIDLMKSKGLNVIQTTNEIKLL